MTEENKHKLVRMRGIPFNADKREIRDFLRGYDVSENDIVLEAKGGRVTGRALV